MEKINRMYTNSIQFTLSVLVICVRSYWAWLMCVCPFDLLCDLHFGTHFVRTLFNINVSWLLLLWYQFYDEFLTYFLLFLASFRWNSMFPMWPLHLISHLLSKWHSYSKLNIPKRLYRFAAKNSFFGVSLAEVSYSMRIACPMNMYMNIPPVIGYSILPKTYFPSTHITSIAIIQLISFGFFTARMAIFHFCINSKYEMKFSRTYF